MSTFVQDVVGRRIETKASKEVDKIGSILFSNCVQVWHSMRCCLGFVGLKIM
jgi:hypothetical protein